MAGRRGCEVCGIPLPPAAARCPSCGHQQGDVVTVEVSGGGGSGPRSRRRDGWLLAAVAGLVVAALAFVGRGDRDGDEKAADPEPSTTTTTTGRRSTTTSRSSTTTTLPPLMLGQPTGVQLLVSSGNSMQLVDLDTGVTLPIQGLADGQFVATPGGFFASSGSGSLRFFAAPYDDPPRELVDDTDRGASLVESTTAGRVWAVTYGPSVTATEVDESGAVTTGPLTIDGGFPVAAVPEGLVVELFGGVYVLRSDGALRRIGYGHVIAAHGSTVAVIGCDAEGTCALQLIPVAGGSIRRIDIGEVGTNRGELFGVFSPDGATLAVRRLTFDFRPTFEITIVDVASAAAHTLGDASFDPGPTTPGSWSRDSRWLFWCDGDVVRAWERGTGHTTAFTPGPPPFTSVTAL